MRDYAEQINSIRLCAESDDPVDECCFEDCNQHHGSRDNMCRQKIMMDAADAIEELLAAVPANRVDYKWLNASNSVIATMTIEKFECGWTSLSNFEIAEAYRGQGLSHKLIEFAKTKGVNNLSVDPNNSIAINLYQQHGFFLTGETDGNFYRMRLTKPPKGVE